MGIYDWQEKHIAEQDARIAELTAEVEQMASWIVRHGQKVTDHACADCLPGGEILVHGFRCGWHAAIARNALKDGV